MDSGVLRVRAISLGNADGERISSRTDPPQTFRRQNCIHFLQLRPIPGRNIARNDQDGTFIEISGIETSANHKGEILGERELEAKLEKVNS